MDQRAFNEHIDSFFRQSGQLLVDRGAEYAGSVDRLANFKRGAALTGCTAQQVAFVYLSKHYDAVATYVREGGSRPGSEPIDGRLHDLVNYILLLSALIKEEADSCDIPT